MDKKRNGRYYYHGYEVSSYGQEHKRVDYRTFARGFNAVLCNNIPEVLDKLNDYSMYDNMVNGTYLTPIENPITGEWEYFDDLNDFEDWKADIEEVHGIEIEEEPTEEYNEVYQYFIVPDTEWNRLDLDTAHQMYFYCESLDCLVWCVCHWGTSWDYVLTDIELTNDMFYEGV